jgi:hypothetical protein
MNVVLVPGVITAYRTHPFELRLHD